MENKKVKIESFSRTKEEQREWENKGRFYRGDKCRKCKKEITIKNNSGLCRHCIMLKNKRNVGHRHSQETIRNMSIIKLSERNGMWKGEDAGYYALHRWVEKRIPKPILCKKCHIRPAYDLSNKGVYDRDLNNWEWLCRKCHMEIDGRIENLKQFRYKGKNGK